EVARVEVERNAPPADGLLDASGAVETDSLGEALEGLRGHSPVVFRGLGLLPGEKALEVPADPRVADVEVVRVPIADDAPVVDEEARRHDAETKRTAELAGGVDEDRKAHTCLLGGWAHPGQALDILSDGDHPEGAAALFPHP